MPKQKKFPSPMPIAQDLLWGGWSALAAGAAVELDDGGYDLITLGHVIHSEGRENGIRLIERCFRALTEHGMLLIGEFVPNDDRTGPPIAMLFGLNMLLHTPAGDVFTMKDYREWLKGAGFRAIKTIRTPSAVSPLILARK